MSGSMPSPFAPTNDLYDAAKVAQNIQSYQDNQLLMQQHQQAIGDNEMKVMGQAAQGLLNMPDEASRAAAYPGEIARLQALGLAKNAPSLYPGQDRLKSFVATSLPVADQYNLGLAVNPALTKQLQQLYGGGAPAAPAAGGGTAAAPGDGLTGDREHDRALIVARESGGDPTALNYVAKADPTALARGATASGKYQFVNSTWREGMQLAGLDPAKYPTAREAPEAVQDQVFNAVYGKYGAAPWQKGAKDWVKDENGQYQLATVRPQMATPPAAPGGGVVARNPGAVQVAGPGAPTPPAAPVAPPAATTDLVGPRPLPPTGAGAPVATPESIANTPFPVSRNALAPPLATTQPPAPVQTAQAQPPAAAPAAPAAPGAAQQPPQQPALPHRWEVPTGTATPQFQQAQALLARAAAAKAIAAQAPPNSPIARQAAVAAARDEQLAASLQQADNIVQTQEGQLNTRTGELKETTKPLPNYVYKPDAGGGVPGYVDTTGTNKPEFMPAQRDAAVAQHDVMELGPLVAQGKATDEQKARYDVAAETYRQPELRENSVTKETVKVYKRDLPAGFPPSSSAVGSSGAGGSTVVMPGLSPAQQEVERDPAAYKVAEKQYERDAEDSKDLSTAVRKSQADQVRIKEMQDVLQRFSTGPGTEGRTAASAFLQRWLPSALTGWEKESANLSGSDAAQAFAKLALVGAGTQEQSVLGARGGYQAIKLFKDANPGVNLQDATNKSILDMQLISNQANADYAQAALSHFADNEQRFSQTHQYRSLAQFDRDWNTQRNPQVYAAAMGAISGQKPEQWTKGLSDSEYDRALQLVSRAKPDAVVNTKSGRFSMQPTAVTGGTPTKPGDTVIRYDATGNRVQ